MTVLENLRAYFEDDFKAAFPEHVQFHNAFVCPLCIQALSNSSELNKAHIWPEKLGGRIFTLAWRKCNSYMGTAIEKHEVERVKYISADKIPVQEVIEGVEGHIGLLLSFRDVNGQPTLIQEISESHSNPQTLATNRDMFESGKILERKVTVSYRGKFILNRAKLTYLHFAYLALFHLVGYQWIFTAQADNIRKQLNEPKRITLPVIFMRIERNLVSSLAKPTEPVLFEVVDDSVLAGYIVATPEVLHENMNRVGVWIPKFAESFEKVLDSDISLYPPSRLKYLGNICKQPGQHAEC